LLAELRGLAPQADYVRDGREAIRQWLAEHGCRKRNAEPLSWDQVLGLEYRGGERLHLQRPASGRHPGLVWSTHLLMLRWCVVHWVKFSPPSVPGWVPAPRTQRKWRRRLRELPRQRNDNGAE
jgi:hypothetical protein